MGEAAKPVDVECVKVSKLEEVSHKMLVLSRLESLVFLWLRRVYGGSCKTFRFGRCQSVKLEGSLARNARFDAPTCLV